MDQAQQGWSCKVEPSPPSSGETRSLSSSIGTRARMTALPAYEPTIRTTTLSHICASCSKINLALCRAEEQHASFQRAALDHHHGREQCGLLSCMMRILRSIGN